ncbi:MAG: phosphate signaling complex protein PhoU [Armatimonadota bacterium]|nr:phosphate signaling complex protein PhoU [Armatimonadota bacterium]
MLNIRQSFHDELAALEQELLQMGTLTGTMLHQAVAAVQQNDVSLAEGVLQQDGAVDELDRKIEAQCIRLLALQQPMARDLRQVESALKVITDLERIGDHAVDIAKIARKLTQEFYLKAPLLDIAPLAERAQTMLHQSLESLVRHDLDLAVQVCNDDDHADDAFKALREELMAMPQRDPNTVFPASYMLLAVVYLERIADHATNIAERVYYIETGERKTLGRRGERSGAA